MHHGIGGCNLRAGGCHLYKSRPLPYRLLMHLSLVVPVAGGLSRHFARVGEDKSPCRRHRWLQDHGGIGQKASAVTYSVKFAAGTTYVIDMISGDQKALRSLFCACWTLPARNFSRMMTVGEGLNARIIYRAEDPGTYQIVATCVGKGAGVVRFKRFARPGRRKWSNTRR